MTRREWMSAAALAVAVPAVVSKESAKLALGFSLYGMKSLSLPDALKVCRECGYDGVELALMPGYHADPAKLTAADRKELRTQLADAKLSLHGLMENLPALGDDAVHKKNLDRLKLAAELANAMNPDRPPPIETVLGGKPAEWPQVKEKLAARLAEWAAVGKAAKVVIAVKPHVANALHMPEQAIWLMKQVNSEFLRVAFDYSHYELRGVKLAAAVADLIPFTSFVHVKDAKGTPEKFEFLLPGEGTTDYVEYAKRLTDTKYTGPVVVEVSGQLSNKAGYDATAAAKTSMRALGPAFGRGKPAK